MKKIIAYCFINIWRTVFVLLLIALSDSCFKKDIFAEANYWWTRLSLPAINSGFIKIAYLLSRNKEYRNLLKYRFDRKGNIHRLFSTIAMLFLPRYDNLQIFCPLIGWPIFIQHGFSTVIVAQEIGSFCWINQQVTIGYSFDKQPPIIGNGVRITAGAKVLGDITVGDNAIIGANAVVTKDVAEKQIVGGVPARVIGKNSDHLLY